MVSSMSSVFETLNAVDVRPQSEKKGQFTYLPWSDAWTVLLTHYPEATHDMLEDVHYADGTIQSFPGTQCPNSWYPI
jgi:hypothetical protein